MKNAPNILFLFSDQHSPHIIGCGGNAIVRTPNLDRMASEGMYFRNAYCQNPLCVPSRASLLSGRHSKSLGIYENKQIMEANSITLPRVLEENGYRTCLVGKAHFNGEQFHGYQQRPYGDIYGQAHQPDPCRKPEYGAAGLGGLLGNTGPSEIPIALTQTEICVAESVKWLQVHKSLHVDQPFFLSVNFDKPHFPLRPPKKYYGHYKGNVSLPSSMNGPDEVVPFVAEARRRFGTKDADAALAALESYYACVEWIDDAIGRILSALDYLDMKENTIVVYTSDHGEMGDEHRIWNKSVFYEASVRVPMMMRFPGRIKAGTCCGDVVGLIDIFPTLCEQCGIEIPSICEGVSLKDCIQSGKPLGREYLYAESAMLGQEDLAGCMVRHRQWKYNYYLDGTEELYDIEHDPNEMADVAKHKEYRIIADALREKVIAFWDPEQQYTRCRATPAMAREKHFYPFSNQFMSCDGTIADARP
ncbi:MAG: sulfatase-like hydrolase/transferase [Spirochaetota bacterium]